MILSGRGAEQHSKGVGHGQRLHQPGPGPRPAGQAGERLGHAHRAGQRPGGPRARPEGRPAPRLPAHRGRGAPRGGGRGVGRRSGVAAAQGQERVRAARRARAGRRHPVALRHGLERRRRLAGRAAGRTPAPVARPPGGVRRVPERDRAPTPTSSCPSYQWAEEEGTMTNLEGRVIRRRRVARPPTGVRGDIDVLRELADRLGCGAKFDFHSPREVFEEFRRATAGRPGRLRRHHLRAASTARTASSGRARRRTTRARRGCSPSGSPTRTAGRGSSPVEHRPAGEEPDAEYPFYFTTGRYKEHYNSGAQTRLRRPADRTRSRGRCCRSTRRRPSGTGVASGELRDAGEPPRAGRVRGRRDRRHPPGHAVRPVPLGRAGGGQPADQPRPRPDQPDARVQARGRAHRRRAEPRPRGPRT